MSKDRTGAGLGIARQEKECRALAQERGLQVVDLYVDNDLSASRGKPRPQYRRMLADIEAGRIMAVVTWHPDRLTRRTSELEAYISATRDVPTYTVTAGTFDLTTPSGRATAKTVGAWAQAEVEQKALRQVAKNRQMAQSGQRIPGGPVPFGYSEDRTTPHSVYGYLVQQAYADVLAGRGLNGIASDWQAAGAPIPQSVTGRWDRSSVKRVLLRATNAGLVVHQGRIVSGMKAIWEPLVSIADYYAARAILTDPARRTSPGSAPRHLLSGIATCGTCGHVLRRQKVRRRGEDQPDIYGCSNTKALRGDCPSPVTIRTDLLEDHVIGRLMTERGNVEAMSVLLSAPSTGAQAAAVANADAKVLGIAQQMAQPDADLPSLLAALEAAKAERQEVADQRADPFTWEAVLTLQEAWDGPQQDVTLVEHRRALVRQHVARLAVRPVGRGNWRQPVADRLAFDLAPVRQPIEAPLGVGGIGRISVTFPHDGRRERLTR
jgi:site-specific DNA recombinase